MLLSVYNQPPETTEDVDSDLLKLFRDYMQKEDALPYIHQNSSFKTIKSGKEVILVAGTASGKTLAAAIPLIWKILTKEINKVIFLYPTIALLEDQQRVLLKIAGITGLKEEVGYIFGGLHRTELIKNLNKKIIVATPDAIYWFFQKNIKYSALLIYGLCLADEFVLDEAHLFSGLMLRNIQHLFSRINKFRKTYLNKDKSKLHLLTATFEENLAELSSGVRINGKSKCGTVKVNFIQKDLHKPLADFIAEINRSLENNYSKILLVSNSARNAHILFEDSKNKQININKLNSEYMFRFGNIKTSDLIEILKKMGMESNYINNTLSIITPKEGICLKDFPKRVRGYFYLSELIELISKEIERAGRTISRFFEQTDEMKARDLENAISGNSSTIKTFFQAFCNVNKINSDKKINFSLYEKWITEVIDQIEIINLEDRIIGTRSELEKRLQNFLSEAFNDKKLRNLIFKKIQIGLLIKVLSLPELNEKEISNLRKKIPLKFLTLENNVKDEILKSIIEGQIDITIRYIKEWHNSEVPVILYTGSMAKSARGGLIELYSDSEISKAILISTSAVEVGVDFDAEVLITEICEGNSFLQRFGRVGRRGNESLVSVLVDGDTYGKLRDKFKEYHDEPVSREEFSSIIKEVFPQKIYVPESTFLDSIHLLVSEEIGRTGKHIVIEDKKAKDLAEKIKNHNIKFSYGLRSTLPSISLKEGITKDPFYLLRYVEQDKLYSSSSPFEIAKADHYFTELLYKKSCWKEVFVNLEKTLAETLWIFYLWNNNIELAKFEEHRFVISQINKLDNKYQKILLANWSRYASRNDPLGQKIYSLKYWNNMVMNNKDKIQLLYGNIYLKRFSDTNFKPEEIEDHFQNPLIIPSQIYLLISGKEKNELRKILKSAGVYGLEEIYYDWDGLEYSSDLPVFIMLEKVSGACFYAYHKLIKLQC